MTRVQTTYAAQTDVRWNDDQRDASEQRFNGLITSYMDDLYRYAYWLSGNRAVADDLVQDTLVRAWKALDKLQDEKAVKGWLLTILRRENARRFERKRPLESEMANEDVIAAPNDYCLLYTSDAADDSVLV